MKSSHLHLKTAILLLTICIALFPVLQSTGQERFVTANICSLHPQPIVKTELNGKTAYFLLDTGSSANLIDSREAKNFNFKVMKTRNKRLLLSSINGLNADFNHAYNMDIRLAGVKIYGSFLSLDLEFIIASVRRKTGISISGVIGSETMKNQYFVIDYESGKVMIKSAKIR